MWLVVDRMTATFSTGIPDLAANNGKGNRYQGDPLHGLFPPIADAPGLRRAE
jgi:hypothetical protein